MPLCSDVAFAMTQLASSSSGLTLSLFVCPKYAHPYRAFVVIYISLQAAKFSAELRSSPNCLQPSQTQRSLASTSFSALCYTTLQHHVFIPSVAEVDVRTVSLCDCRASVSHRPIARCRAANITETSIINLQFNFLLS